VTEARKFQAVKGTRDILPPDSVLWNRVEQVAREVFASYGFGEIRLPVFETTDLFARSIGLGTDVVSKEMYSFEDHEEPELSGMRYFVLSGRPLTAGPEQVFDRASLLYQFAQQAEQAFSRNAIPRTPDNVSWFARLKGQSQSITHALASRDGALLDSYLLFLTNMVRALDLGVSLTLRPEATASVVRAYIEHGMETLPGDVKLYYMGPMFRRERPQKGRYRQFYQIGAELIGQSDNPSIDAEIVEMLTVFLKRCRLTSFRIIVNSIGCSECRPRYVEHLRAALVQVKDKLGPDSQRRIETNPLRVLDSKLESEQDIIDTLPRISNFLCNDCDQHYIEFKRQLDDRGIEYGENWRLVRGLDYYMRTTFEITAPGLGAQDAICGGGRYDGLVELLGGPKGTKGIGFAIGEDRLVQALQSSAGQGVGLGALDFVVTGTTPVTWPEAERLAASFRKNGLSVYIPPPNTRLKKALGLANSMGARVVVIVGEDELKENKYGIRVMLPFQEGEPRDSKVDQSNIEIYGRIVRLRADLERALTRWTGLTDPSRQALGLAKLVGRLEEQGKISHQMAGTLKDLIPTLNSAAHGSPISRQMAWWALATGNLLLQELDKLPSLGEL